MNQRQVDSTDYIKVIIQIREFEITHIMFMERELNRTRNMKLTMFVLTTLLFHGKVELWKK